MYVVAPVRVCNYYLVDQQVTAGYGLIAFAIAVGITVVAIGSVPFKLAGHGAARSARQTST
jgi:hypothetical protein